MLSPAETFETAATIELKGLSIEVPLLLSSPLVETKYVAEYKQLAASIIATRKNNLFMKKKFV